jgi:alpha-amylase/alpha-mannosidase (GH57 family)
MDRYLCIHCHFYQPPRENPWLEAVEQQDSAYPYHDWNRRITAECYAPNAASRLLDGSNRITKIVNNYAHISFNFGPTLLSWMEENAPATYQSILDADRESREQRSGHGNALAQTYNHMILPLANRADKYTQILWGIWDFEHRFGRHPEGMWLPETAVDTETLEILADLGIGFTVLAQRQARRVRRVGGRTGKDVQGVIDPSRGYRLRLPSRRVITVFFYDGPISQAVAFEGLLANGEQFAQRLLSGFSDARTWPQLMHIATDGETYGHHHKYGDMALAYALDHIAAQNLAKITNYGEFLEQHPPTHEVEIVENSSWSCIHGIERWRADCACSTGGRPGWNQQWRAPLREALDWLRDDLTPRFEQKAATLLKDPWLARNDYVDVVLERTPENQERFFEKHARASSTPAINPPGVEALLGPNSAEDKVTILKLMELQRHAMLMYTSCGWFFDELSGIETVQVIMYAARAVQLAQELFGDHIEENFLEKLALARGNIAEHGTGADIYRNWVKPAAIDLLKVGAHYVISSLFDPYGQHSKIYCYSVDREDHRVFESGRARLAVGNGRVSSRVTQECAHLAFAALHLGDHNLNAGTRYFRGQPDYDWLVSEVSEAFLSGDVPAALRALDRQFVGVTYSLKSLFRDEQRRIVSTILDSTLAEAEGSFRQLYERHAPLIRFLGELGTAPPKVLHMTAEFVLNGSLRRAFEEEDLDLDRIRTLLDAAQRERVQLDGAGLSYALNHSIELVIERLQAEPAELKRLERLEAVIDMARSLPFEVNLWKVQNRYYQMLRQVRPEFQARGDEEARAWLARFDSLGEKLRFRIPESQPFIPSETPVPTAV